LIVHELFGMTTPTLPPVPKRDGRCAETFGSLWRCCAGLNEEV
jgi:hypothetical protein